MTTKVGEEIGGELATGGVDRERLRAVGEEAVEAIVAELRRKPRE